MTTKLIFDYENIRDIRCFHFDLGMVPFERIYSYEPTSQVWIQALTVIRWATFSRLLNLSWPPLSHQKMMKRVSRTSWDCYENVYDIFNTCKVSMTST